MLPKYIILNMSKREKNETQKKVLYFTLLSNNFKILKKKLFCVYNLEHCRGIIFSEKSFFLKINKYALLI